MVLAIIYISASKSSPQDPHLDSGDALCRSCGGYLRPNTQNAGLVRVAISLDIYGHCCLNEHYHMNGPECMLQSSHDNCRPHIFGNNLVIFCSAKIGSSNQDNFYHYVVKQYISHKDLQSG